MTTHQEIQNLIPAFALGCLDEDEAVQLAEHCAICPSCRAELAGYQDTVSQLALAAPLVEPAPQMQQRLTERVRSIAGVATPRPSNRWQTMLAGLKQSVPMWGAVVVLLLVGMGLEYMWLATPALEPMQVIELTHTQAAPDASGVMVVSSDGEYGTVIVENLPELSVDQQYQLWLIANGQRTSGAVFSVDEHGYRAVEVEAVHHLTEYGSFGITIEPAGGSPGPTGSKVLGGNF